jgi:hypothetical protein
MSFKSARRRHGSLVDFVDFAKELESLMRSLKALEYLLNCFFYFSALNSHHSDDTQVPILLHLLLKDKQSF